MKYLGMLTAFVVLLQCLAFSRQVPMSGTTQHDAGDPEEVKTTPPAKLIVMPGMTETNGDVTVENTSSGQTNATVSPKQGDSSSESTVTTDTGFRGTISGVDMNDTVNLGSNQGDSSPMGIPVTVNTAGGNVILKGGSHVRVSNALASTATTVVQLQNGSTVELEPGSSVRIRT